MRRTLISATVALGLLAATPGLAAPKGVSVVSQDLPPSSEQLPSDSNPGVQAFRVRSERIGRDFEIVVHLPGPTAFLADQKFPVVYALDGGMGLAGQTGLLLGVTGLMAPAYVVEVGYPKGQAGTMRNEDLTFLKTPERPVSGGGAAFEAFLVEDLRAFLEAKFPLDPHRSVLIGHSLGGLFTAHMFADKPDAFSGYIIGSASVWADPAVTAAVAQAARGAKGERVYIGVSDLEDLDGPPKPPSMMDGFRQLGAAFKGQPAIALKTQVYVGQNHASYYPRLVLDAFPFVLPPARPANFRDQPLSEQALKRYLGAYKLADGRTLTITPLKSPSGATMRLRAQVAGKLPLALMEAGKDRFYAKSADLDVTFDGAGLTLASGDAKLRGEKVGDDAAH